MIKKNTLFIFGAGASASLGFPIAKDLRKRILEKINPETSWAEGYWSSLMKKFEALGFNEELVRTLHHDLSSINKTIDEFIKTRKHEHETKLCKYIIADALSEKRFNYKSWGVEGDDPWPDYFIQNICPDDSKDFPTDKIKVLTFNYDLTIEEIFLQGLKAQYRTFDPIIIPEIVHVFGKINEHDGHDNLGVIEKDYSDVMERIKFFHEPINRDDEIKSLMKWADEIMFLGFGFHTSNIDLLGIKRVDMNKQIYSSSYGLPPDIAYRMAEHTKRDIIFNPNNNHRCKETLELFFENRIGFSEEPTENSFASSFPEFARE